MSEYGPLYCGIDPGAKGGLALLSLDNQFQVAYPFPETEREICDLFTEYAPNIELCCLEFVHSFPAQGVSSTFKFGVSYGLLRGILIALKIPFEDLRPERWTKALGFKKVDRGRPTKRLHRSWAQQWFPRLKIDDHTADAVLIAEYLRRQYVRPPLLSGVEEMTIK